jgi:hypothetical protein
MFEVWKKWNEMFVVSPDEENGFQKDATFIVRVASREYAEKYAKEYNRMVKTFFTNFATVRFPNNFPK